MEESRAAAAAERRSAEDRPRPLVEALLVLSFTAGMIDAIGLIGLAQSFLTVMTGNLTLLGIGIAAAAFDPKGPAIALLAFVFGAALFGRWEDDRKERHKRLIGIVRVETAAVAVAMGIAIVFSIADESTRLVVTALISAAMGARNVAIRRLRVPEMRTTVMTLAIAGLVSDEAEHRNTPADRRMLGGIVALLAGALSGGLLVAQTSVAVALGAVLVVQSLALTILVRRLRSDSPHRFG